MRDNNKYAGIPNNNTRNCGKKNATTTHHSTPKKGKDNVPNASMAESYNNELEGENYSDAQCDDSEDDAVGILLAPTGLFITRVIILWAILLCHNKSDDEFRRGGIRMCEFNNKEKGINLKHIINNKRTVKHVKIDTLNEFERNGVKTDNSMITTIGANYGNANERVERTCTYDKDELEGIVFPMLKKSKHESVTLSLIHI